MMACASRILIHSYNQQVTILTIPVPSFYSQRISCDKLCHKLRFTYLRPCQQYDTLGLVFVTSRFEKVCSGIDRGLIWPKRFWSLMMKKQQYNSSAFC